MDREDPPRDASGAPIDRDVPPQADRRPASGRSAKSTSGPSEPDSRPSETLLRAAFSGDRVAFQELTEQLWGLIFVFIRQRVSDRQRAEDLTQDTFLQAWEKRSTLRRPESGVSWLLAIASRKVIDSHRWFGSRPESPWGDAPDPGDPSRGEGSTHSEPEEAARLQEAVADLPELYRTVLVLRYWSGLTPAQIARLLGEPEGTIRNRIFRAHLQLRGRLTAPDRPEGPGPVGEVEES